MKTFDQWFETINPNDDDDIAELRQIYTKLAPIAASMGVDLQWVDIKDTVYFFPQLKAKE